MIETIKIYLSRNSQTNGGKWCVWKTDIPIILFDDMTLDEIFAKWPNVKNKILSRNLKIKRYYDVGKKCEICHKPLLLMEAKRHHKVFRKDGGKSTYSNSEIRCKECEVEYHKKFS